MQHPHPPLPPTAPPLPFAHVCRAGCVSAPVHDPAPLPPRLTLSAPSTMRYAELLATLTAAHARGVRQARVVVEYTTVPSAAQ